MARTFNFVTSHDRKKTTRTNSLFAQAGLPFIVQWCRNVKDAECPPDTRLCARGRVSSLHCVTAVHRSAQAGRQEAHPQSDPLETWSPREHKRILQLRPDDSTSYVLFAKGHNRISGRRVRAVETQDDILSRCLAWGEVITDYYGKMCEKYLSIWVFMRKRRLFSVGHLPETSPRNSE